MVDLKAIRKADLMGFLTVDLKGLQMVDPKAILKAHLKGFLMVDLKEI